MSHDDKDFRPIIPDGSPDLRSRRIERKDASPILAHEIPGILYDSGLICHHHHSYFGMAIGTIRRKAAKLIPLEGAWALDGLSGGPLLYGRHRHQSAPQSPMCPQVPFTIVPYLGAQAIPLSCVANLPEDLGHDKEVYIRTMIPSCAALLVDASPGGRDLGGTEEPHCIERTSRPTPYILIQTHPIDVAEGVALEEAAEAGMEVSRAVVDQAELFVVHEALVADVAEAVGGRVAVGGHALGFQDRRVAQQVVRAG